MTFELYAVTPTDQPDAAAAERAAVEAARRRGCTCETPTAVTVASGRYRVEHGPGCPDERWLEASR